MYGYKLIWNYSLFLRESNKARIKIENKDKNDIAKI